MARRAYGLFISRFQGMWIPKPWQDYVIIKCTDGLYQDPLYETFLQTARDAGKLVGATHYLRSDVGVVGQTDNFLDHSKGADFLSLDFEGIGNTKSVTFATSALAALERTRKLSGKKVLFYSSPKYIMEWMFQLGIYWVRDESDLWIAQWPFSTWTDRLLEVPDIDRAWYPWLPAGCVNWRAWQYGAEYLGRGEYEGVGSTHVCLEVFNGTIDQMREWAGEDVIKPPISMYTWNQAVDLVKDRLDELKD